MSHQIRLAPARTQKNCIHVYFFAFRQSVRISAYVFDDSGYHEIPLPPEGPDSSTGVVDFRPIDTGSPCDLSKGEYCIDRKLLNLMVG